jgi:CubicO group peptidase (beta-lactamase class C family)
VDREPVSRPADLGVDPARLARALDVLKRGVLEEGAAPGAVVCAARHGRVFLHEAVGTLDGERPAALDSLYDLASLTKPMATAASVLTLVEEGRLHLLAPLSALLGEAAGPWGKRTVHDLLTHVSGLPAWTACYKDGTGLDAAVRAILSLPAEDRPEAGQKYEYSCLNFILLGRIVEQVSGLPLDRFARENVHAPLGQTDTGYRPDPSLRPRIAPTTSGEGPGLAANTGAAAPDAEQPSVDLCGEVHDGNARGIGGVSGNAGLFGTAGDVCAFGAALLHPEKAPHRLFGAPTLARALENQVNPAVGGHTLLFFANPNGFNPTGDLLSPRAVGHSGFTGTVLTLDPVFDLAVAVVSNAVHRTGAKGKWLPLRRRFLNALAAALV